MSSSGVPLWLVIQDHRVDDEVATVYPDEVHYVFADDEDQAIVAGGGDRVLVIDVDASGHVLQAVSLAPLWQVTGHTVLPGAAATAGAEGASQRVVIHGCASSAPPPPSGLLVTDLLRLVETFVSRDRRLQQVLSE